VSRFVQWNPKRKDSPGWVLGENDCHIWQGYRDENGYGVVHDHGRKRRVHCVRYEREIGPVPSGMELDHFVCDNGAGGCCNPFHCRPATHRENVLRSNSISSLNAAKTHCPLGHPLSGDNLRPHPLAQGRRECRVCHNSRERDRKRVIRRRVA
jgi:hypothetical protein